jgi:hypothetical protein
MSVKALVAQLPEEYISKIEECTESILLRMQSFDNLEELSDAVRLQLFDLLICVKETDQ